MTLATGIGSWPGTDMSAALAAVRDLLADRGEGGLPYLPELPARGPGADLVGRGAALLEGLAVDLQPVGWRFVDRRGGDARRAAAFWRADLDGLAEAFDGWTGRLKLQVAGPWTLASNIWLHRGERALVDKGAARDLVQSLAEGVRRHLGEVQRLVPGATLVLQVDEPALPAVLEGRLPTASGFGRVPALQPPDAAAGLAAVLAAAGGRDVVLHCCAPGIPLPLMRGTGAALAVDTSLLGPQGWEGVAVAVEDGRSLYAGCLPTSGTPDRAGDVADTVAAAWHRVGLPASALAQVVVTPACGLASLTPQAARDVQQACTHVAERLSERAAA